MNSTNVLVADWGGDNCRSAVVEVDGDPNVGDSYKIIDGTYVRLSTKERPDIDGILMETIGESRKIYEGALHGTSVNVAGPVEDHEAVLSAANTPALRDAAPFNLRDRIVQLFKLPGTILNDLEAALDGETLVGRLRGKSWAILENWGRGYGGARLYNGASVAAEPGHVWLPSDTEHQARCGCGREGCVEAEWSGGAMRRKIEELCEKEGIAIPEGTDPCAFADERAEQGDEWAVKLYTSAAITIGELWGSKLNDCPLITDIVYQGTFLVKAMRIEFFRNTVREIMLRRSMFSNRHEGIQIAEVAAPMYREQPSGPLYGDARKWMQLLGGQAG